MAKIDAASPGCVVCPEHIGPTLSVYAHWRHIKTGELRLLHRHMCISCASAYQQMHDEAVESNGWVIDQVMIN